MEYPKIETLYERDPSTHKVTDAIRCPEFGIINSWHITEKIDGTNIRVLYSPGEQPQFCGRTGNAQMPKPLEEYLTETFTPDVLAYTFSELGGIVTLFGEGYGEKIQKGGGNYRSPRGIKKLQF